MKVEEFLVRSAEQQIQPSSTKLFGKKKKQRAMNVNSTIKLTEGVWHVT
jgi:hypothetical protein